MHEVDYFLFHQNFCGSPVGGRIIQLPYLWAYLWACNKNILAGFSIICFHCRYNSTNIVNCFKTSPGPYIFVPEVYSAIPGF